MDAKGFEGDPFHEGATRPMEGLKGTSAEVHTQQVMKGSNDSNSNQHPAPVAHSWVEGNAAPPGGTSGGGNPVH